jgi:hypothetical protein
MKIDRPIFPLFLEYGSESGFERQRGEDFGNRRFPRTAALAGRQAPPGALFQRLRELGCSQRASRASCRRSSAALRFEMGSTQRGPEATSVDEHIESIRARGEDCESDRHR